MRIRIIAVPSGKAAPEEIRKLWVGIEMESIGKEEPTDKDVLTGRLGRTNLGGYMVTGEEAFKALEAHNKEAYDWWKEHCPNFLCAVLVFHTEVCEVLSP